MSDADSDCPDCRGADTPHANYDIGVREDLVDVLDMHMRLDDRGDAERVADALIDNPGLLRALAAFSVVPAAPHAFMASPVLDAEEGADHLGLLYERRAPEPPQDVGDDDAPR